MKRISASHSTSVMMVLLSGLCVSDAVLAQSTSSRSPSEAMWEAVYRAGERQRAVGIYLATIGGGLGLVSGGVALGLGAYCQNSDRRDKSGCTEARTSGIGLLAGGGLSLAVGITLALIGSRRMALARDRAQTLLPAVEVSLTANHAHLSAGWHF